MIKYSLAFLLAYFCINFLLLIFYMYKNWEARGKFLEDIEIIIIILLAGIFALIVSQTYEDINNKEEEEDD